MQKGLALGKLNAERARQLLRTLAQVDGAAGGSKR